jgi:drug/metabolite transporter (DMT)-like permease
MSWLIFAFSGPVLWAISTHLDKYLVERYFKHSDVVLLLLFTAFMGVAILPFIAWFEPSAIGLPAGSVALIMLSGVLYMAGLLFYLRAIQSEEASVVAPFFQIAPLFGYVLAYIVLGETLSARQLAGGSMIIAGTLIVSIRFDRKVSRFKARLVLLMLACGLAMALSGLIFKLFALRVDFWATTFWMFVGEAIFGAAPLLIARYRRQFIAVLRQDTAALLAISGSNELFNLGGTVGSRYALLFAPLSIVQAIGSTTTLFVFAFGVVLSVFYPRAFQEKLAVRDLAQKAVAAVVVAIGVALVTR